MIKQRIDSLLLLGDYLKRNTAEWQAIKQTAERKNGWFTQDFIDCSVRNICQQYLEENALRAYAQPILTAEQKQFSRKIGITMAGNIPLVGFHDFLTVYLSGHQQVIKFSSKDDVLLPHLIDKIYSFDKNNRSHISTAEMLKGCDAFIATGSNSSALYFEKYFARFPHIIRKNKTSVAVLDGNESDEQLALLADDVFLYFGLGCRNVSKIYVPEQYDFMRLLNAFKRYDYLAQHHKYKNNYDYNLAIFILNNQFYMSTEALLLSENTHNFSPIAVLNYSYYSGEVNLQNTDEVQAVCGNGHIPFGQSQSPTLTDFADGVNPIEFLNSL